MTISPWDGDGYSGWDENEAQSMLDQWMRERIPHMTRVYYDPDDHEFHCHCRDYRERQKCRHIWRYRATETVPVDDRYL